MSHKHDSSCNDDQYFKVSKKDLAILVEKVVSSDATKIVCAMCEGLSDKFSVLLRSQQLENSPQGKVEGSITQIESQQEVENDIEEDSCVSAGPTDPSIYPDIKIVKPISDSNQIFRFDNVSTDTHMFKYAKPMEKPIPSLPPASVSRKHFDEALMELAKCKRAKNQTLEELQAKVENEKKINHSLQNKLDTLSNTRDEEKNKQIKSLEHLIIQMEKQLSLKDIAFKQLDKQCNKWRNELYQLQESIHLANLKNITHNICTKEKTIIQSDFPDKQTANINVNTKQEKMVQTDDILYNNRLNQMTQTDEIIHKGKEMNDSEEIIQALTMKNDELNMEYENLKSKYDVLVSSNLNENLENEMTCKASKAQDIADKMKQIYPTLFRNNSSNFQVYIRKPNANDENDICHNMSNDTKIYQLRNIMQMKTLSELNISNPQTMLDQKFWSCPDDILNKSTCSLD